MTIAIGSRRSDGNPALRAAESWGRSEPAMGLADHQYVKCDDRRQAQDHGPDSERPKHVFGTEALLFAIWIVTGSHVRPRVFAFMPTLISVEF